MNSPRPDDKDIVDMSLYAALPLGVIVRVLIVKITALITGVRVLIVQIAALITGVRILLVKISVLITGVRILLVKISVLSDAHCLVIALHVVAFRFLYTEYPLNTP